MTPVRTSAEMPAAAPRSGEAPCHWLAIAGGCAAAAVSALFFRGWVVTGHRIDLVPSVVTALVTALSVKLLGRVDGKWHAVYAGGAALVGLVAGYGLAWDLFGIVAAQAGEAGAAGGWFERLATAWDSRTTSEQWLNVFSYVLSPCLAVSAAALWRRLDRENEGGRATAGASSTPAVDAPQAVAVRPLCRAAAAAWALGVLSLWLAVGGGERNGFTRLSFPCEPSHAPRPLTGFNYLRQGVPIMAEEVPALEQVDWFSGEVRSDNNFRFLRSGYALLAAHATPWLDRDRALLVVNILSWCGCVASVWVLCRHVFREEAAAAVAVCMAATGTGLAIHIHGLSPHIAGFALYYCGATWLAISGVSTEARPWRWHCATGLGFGLIGIVYNAGPMLLAVYLCNGAARQCWKHLAGGAALALAVRPLWRFILPALGINVVDTEAEYLSAALHAWAEWWNAGVGVFLRHAVRLALESATACDSPVVLALGSLAVFVGPRSWRDFAFGVPVLAAPVLASTVFAPAATARGYIVYGMTLWLYCCVGGWLARGLQRGGATAVVMAGVLGLALAGQMAWSTAHLWGWLGPAKTYFLGWDDGWPVLQHGPTQVVSLTGAEPTPVAFGGTATLVDAGAVDLSPTSPVVRKSRVLAWLSRLPLLFTALLFGVAALPARRTRRRLAVLALALWLGGGEASFRTLNAVPAYFSPFQGAALAPHGAGTLRIQVAAEGLAPIRQQFQSGEFRLGLFLPPSAPVQLSLQVDGQDVPLEPDGTGFCGIL